ncbi:unnamed protein product, partial [Staurois parvus]
MTLGRKGLTCGAIKGLTVCCFTRWAVSVCFTVSTLLWMAVLCTAIQSSVPELTGRTVSKQNSSPHRRISSEITRRWPVI